MTPLPEPKYHARDDFDYYTEAQLEAYGAAEYKRGIEDAAQVCEKRDEILSMHLTQQISSHAVTSAKDFTAGAISASRRNAQHIRKLGEQV